MLATPFFEPYPAWLESADPRGNLSLFKYVTPNEDPAAVYNEKPGTCSWTREEGAPLQHRIDVTADGARFYLPVA